MKKILAFLLAGCLALSLTACGQEPAGQTDPAEETVYPACFDGMEDLIAAARAEGALTVYGSCEESYLAAACQHFQELFGITVTYQRTAAGADVWFGGSAENCRAAAEAGQLMAYSAANAVHLRRSAGPMKNAADSAALSLVARARISPSRNPQSSGYARHALPSRGRARRSRSPGSAR